MIDPTLTEFKAEAATIRIVVLIHADSMNSMLLAHMRRVANPAPASAGVKKNTSLRLVGFSVMPVRLFFVSSRFSAYICSLLIRHFSTAKPHPHRTMKKRGQDNSRRRRKYVKKPVESWLTQGVLVHEMSLLLADNNLTLEEVEINISKILNDDDYRDTAHTTISGVKIDRVTTSGEGLGLISNDLGHRVVVVPFALPGDVVTARIFKSSPTHVEADLIKVETPSKYRDDSLIKCEYFGVCLGCQYQNVEYQTQLEFKRNTIVNAYKFFAGNTTIPEISATHPLPKQYHYRTKLTPHFDMPMANYKQNKPLEACPPLGFGRKGRPEWRSAPGGEASILDIEQCVIGTPIINIGMTNERARLQEEFTKYRRGATILLREDTTPLSAETPVGLTDGEGKILEIEEDGLRKTCATDSRQVVHEVVDGYTMEFTAGEFFQNNNLILRDVTGYVKGHLALPGVAEPVLVDAYCGLGLFSIVCSKGVSKVIGVEISANLVEFARRNAANNNVDNARFIVGLAECIFEGLDVDADSTLVILDPPRRGSDEAFLSQLAKLGPAKIVYISCNVNSQARDVEYFMKVTEGRYEVEEIKGFDFFPNTHHVELVAVLKRVTK